jgi:hypothetical protein
MNFKSDFFSKKNLIIGLLTFLFIIFVFINFMHNSYEGYEKIENLNGTKIISNEPLFKLKTNNLKNNISKRLVNNEHYKHVLNRDCKVTGNLHDRHKVRWVRAIIHQELLRTTYKINKIAPYYTEIILHSLLIFISLLLLRKFFFIEDKYSVFYLLFFTYIFQQYLGEYTYSVFDLIFITLALCSSKAKNFAAFLATCCLAVLNRETGFLIIFSWLIFNNEDLKKFIAVAFLAAGVFLLANYDIVSCIFQPKFFTPMQYQHGQVNFTDLMNANIVSTTKALLINYIIPFGIGFYFYYKSKIKNKYLILIFLLYLFTFLIGSPVHKMELRILLLPYLWLFIFFHEKKIAQ